MLFFLYPAQRNIHRRRLSFCLLRTRRLKCSYMSRFVFCFVFCLQPQERSTCVSCLLLPGTACAAHYFVHARAQCTCATHHVVFVFSLAPPRNIHRRRRVFFCVLRTTRLNFWYMSCFSFLLLCLHLHTAHTEVDVCCMLLATSYF